MSEKIFLTRNQLAKFLPTPEAIKAFENLFKIATQQTPNNLDEIQISAESALSMANYSLSVLDNVSKLIEALELQPPETPTISEDVIDIPIVNINECECLEIIKEPDWNFIKNHPTTISGYGITDAYSAVVADAPLTGSGTTSSHLSIPAATSLANGYLSSTDWSTFNNKQSAYTNLSSIGSLANNSGWLHNDGSGVFAYSTPTKSDVGLSNVTNNAQVTSVSGTSPINSSGGTTPAISIDKADSTHNGYLSSTDWSTFNNKQSALTTGNLTETTSSILTITGGTGAIIGSGTTIAVTKSDSTHSGYLSSTDWSTFNSKEPAQTKGSITEATSSVLTITNGSNSTVGPNVTIQVKQSTNAVSGYLSSTDWTTFNGKQAAYTNLTSIGGLANGTGWLKNNGSGAFSYSTPTKSDVGLGNVDNTADSNKSVSSASTLTTARNINGVSFNGSADITTPINTTQKSDDVEYNLPFVSSVTAGNQSVYTDSVASITYNPSTNTLTTSNLKGKMTNNDTTMVSTNQTLTNWWGMYLATLGNSPIAGNPTKWIKIDDNGTIRYIPTWS